MTEKPSLYVVEKREVIILVVLFVLVTVLSFTIGVRYGESVGKKSAQEMAKAEAEQGEAASHDGAGTLGEAKAAGEHAADPEHGKAPTDAKAAHGEAEHGHAAAEAQPAHGEAHAEKAEHGGHEAPAPAHGEDSHSPEAAAMESGNHEALDKSSDEYLLNALKEAGVEPPGGKAPKGAKLPDDVKPSAAKPRIPSGSYVIQVGSHSTRSEAESQVRQLKARHVEAQILPVFRDKQGEWHRVVLGSYKNKRDADREATGLKRKGSIVSYFVWRLP